MLLAIALVAFVSLGLPDAVLGVAWPSIRRTFGLPADQLGTLLASAMAGYLVSSFSSGAVVARLGVGWLLFWSSTLMVVNSLAYALAPTWGVMVAASVLAGLGAGAIDAGINAFAAARFSPRRVSWLHASYGVGATLGPLLMTAVLTWGRGWRWGYAVIGLVLAAMSVAFLLTIRLWDREQSEPGKPGDARKSVAGLFDTLARPRVWLNVALFFVYTGSRYRPASGATPCSRKPAASRPALQGSGSLSTGPGSPPAASSPGRSPAGSQAMHCCGSGRSVAWSAPC